MAASLLSDLWSVKVNKINWPFQPRKQPKVAKCLLYPSWSWAQSILFLVYQLNQYLLILVSYIAQLTEWWSSFLAQFSWLCVFLGRFGLGLRNTNFYQLHQLLPSWSYLLLIKLSLEKTENPHDSCSHVLVYLFDHILPVCVHCPSSK